MLSAMGCDALQGWAFARAMPLHELLESYFGSGLDEHSGSGAEVAASCSTEGA